MSPTSFSLNVPERLDRLIAEGKIPKVIGVFADGWTALGGSQWLNSEGLGRYRDVVARDLLHWTDRTFRTIPKGTARALIGKSSGGYGALVLARFHPDLFQHIAVHSGDSGFEYCYLPDLPKAAAAILKAGGIDAWYRDFLVRADATKMGSGDHAVISMLCMAAAYSPKKGEPLNLELPIELPSGRLRVDVWNRWLIHDPVRFVPKHIEAFKKLRSLFVDCGVKDEFNLRWGARLVSEELQSSGIEHLHEEFDDGHMGINYRLERSLSYIVPRLDK
jgi:hypothetical protein